MSNTIFYTAQWRFPSHKFSRHKQVTNSSIWLLLSSTHRKTLQKEKGVNVINSVFTSEFRHINSSYIQTILHPRASQYAKMADFCKISDKPLISIKRAEFLDCSHFQKDFSVSNFLHEDVLRLSVGVSYISNSTLITEKSQRERTQNIAMCLKPTDKCNHISVCRN